MFTPPQNLRRMLAIGAAVSLAAALVATPVAAHTELRGSDPEEGATVDTLEQVRLEFSSALLDIGSQLVLVDAAGEEHELTPEFPAGENAVVASVEAQGLPAGATVLDWRIVAEDGHPIEGQIAFSYAPAEIEEPAAEPEETADAAPADEPGETPEDVTEPEPTDEPTSLADEATDDEAESNGMALWVWVLLGLAVAGLTAMAVAMSRKRDDK